jgi:hypothetical protein
MAVADEDGSREELIRSAMRTITHGTQEIHATFSQARGPLSKAVIRDLHRRVKDLRQTAESAEDAFRDWTVDLSGRPYEKEAKLRYEELRASFEQEVASIQQSMARVADEVKRRQTSKASQQPMESSQSEMEEPPAMPQCPLVASPAPAPGWRSPSPTPVPAQASVPSTASASAPPSRRVPTTRSDEARMHSHTSLASCLEEIASQEDQTRRRMAENVMIISEGCKMETHGKAALRERIASVHPSMKYIIWVALLSLAYVIWSEARYLMSNIAHEESLRGARAGRLELPPHMIPAR